MLRKTLKQLHVVGTRDAPQLSKLSRREQTNNCLTQYRNCSQEGVQSFSKGNNSEKVFNNFRKQKMASQKLEEVSRIKNVEVIFIHHIALALTSLFTSVNFV